MSGAGLPLSRVVELSRRDGVDEEAASNFLATMDGLTQAEALANLERDTLLYGWNTATGRAIQQGIMEARLG